MKANDIISLKKLCRHYNIPFSFINALNEFELIEIVTIQERQCVYKTQIKDIEKMIRFHYEFDINIEGIDAIYNLLKQVESLKDEINKLNNRLKLYES